MSRSGTRLSWLHLRLTIYAIVMLVCWIMPHLTAGDVNESFADFARAWPISAIMIGALMYTAFLMLVGGAFVLMIGAQIGTSAPSERWLIPQHDLNPFRFSHPATFWHFGGWLALAGTIVRCGRLGATGFQRAECREWWLTSIAIDVTLRCDRCMSAAGFDSIVNCQAM